MLRDVALSRKFESLVYAKPVSVLNPEPKTALHEVEEEDYHVKCNKTGSLFAVRTHWQRAKKQRWQKVLSY